MDCKEQVDWTFRLLGGLTFGGVGLIRLFNDCWKAESIKQKAEGLLYLAS